MKPVDENLLSLDSGTRDGWRLPASHCSACGAEFHPPRARCPRCGAAELQEVSLPKTGRLLSYTLVHQTSPASMIAPPYYVGLVEIDEGPVIEAVGASRVAASTLLVGARVRLVLEPLGRDEDGEEIVSYRFVLDEDTENQDE